VRRAEVDLAAATRIAPALRQPTRLWEVYGVHAMLALAAARLSEADALIRKAYAFGERAQPEAAVPVYRLQRYILNDFSGQIEEVEPEIRDLVVEYPARPVFRCAPARLHAVLGRPSEVTETLDELAADDFSILPFDQEWLFGMSLLAEAAVVVGDADAAPILYRLLLPWAALNVVDQAEGIRGSLSRYLGMLAASMQFPANCRVCCRSRHRLVADYTHFRSRRPPKRPKIARKPLRG